MDQRLGQAVHASLRWYEDVFALHGVPTRTGDGLWQCVGDPPPLHSAVKTLAPAVGRDRVLAAVGDRRPVTVADSFGALDLAGDGFRVLFEASWIHHPQVVRSPGPAGWHRVADEADLVRWREVHGAEGVFTSPFLTAPSFWLLGRRDRTGALDAVVVLHDAGPVVGVSNIAAVPGARLDWSEVLDLVARDLPGRPVVDYTRGPDLDDAVANGFTALGPQVVWVRD